MTREWKPGDVAMVEVGCHANRYVGVFMKTGWRYGADKWVANDPIIVTARPLVVIDPEDREQVERLARVAHECQFVAEWRHLHESTRKAQTDAMQAALREFANPTPPKPPEPTGLGAVVEDAEGVRWVRASLTSTVNHWRCADVGGIGRKPWTFVNAVRILSDGVTP